MKLVAQILQLALYLKMIKLLTCVFRLFYCVNEEYLPKPFKDVKQTPGTCKYSVRTAQ